MIEIKDKTRCCGCEACKNICPTNCISMIEDKEGFLYPNVDLDSCINCNKCVEVCPILQVEPQKEKKQRAFLVQINNDKICKESTSGGGFTAIAQKVIEHGGVVFGAAFDENFDVYHTFVDTEEALFKFRNSKYVQSRMGNSFQKVKEMLNENRMVLFSGTPCQIEGLYHYLGGHKENLILADIVCRAVPSPLVWKKYKQFRQPDSDAELVEASFRNKDKYGYQYSQMKMGYSNGTTIYSGVESDPYLRAFFSDLIDRPSCYDCKFKKRYRVSDITMWDCFDVYRIDKEFDDNKGMTRILTHKKKGEEFIFNLDKCRRVEIGPDLAVKGVKELVESVSMNSKREDFFNDCEGMNGNELFNNWFPDNIKTKTKRIIRISLQRFGIYSFSKRVARKLQGR